MAEFFCNPYEALASYYRGSRQIPLGDFWELKDSKPSGEETSRHILISKEHNNER
jgi:hypothetical protein